MTNGNPTRVSGIAILVSVVTLICIIAAMVTALAIAGKLDSDSTPLVVTILGFVGVAIPSLVALLRADEARTNSAQTRNIVQQTSDDLRNGLIPSKLNEAVQNGVISGTLRIQPKRDGLRTRATDPPETRTDLSTEGKNDG